MKKISFILMLAFVALGLHANAQAMKPITGYPYAIVTSDHYGYYYSRTLYCVNDNTHQQWVQQSFGMDFIKYSEECING